jgi:hypothetical protein
MAAYTRLNIMLHEQIKFHLNIFKLNEEIIPFPKKAALYIRLSPE